MWMRAALVLLLALDPAFVTNTVESLGATIRREYFDAAVGARVDEMLRRSLADGRYSAAPDDAALAAMVTRDLYAATHDKHLVLQALRDVPAERERSASQADASRAVTVRRSNAGVRRIEILAGNVGCLELTNFFRPEEASDAIAAAMQTLAHADALILDLRSNGGGSPSTVALLASYLLEPGLPLWDIAHRPPESPDHYATVTVSRHDVTRPVYVLTSSQTFSGGEGLAFILQERHRAEIVGEVTAGAANAGRPYRVNARFSVTVPNGQVQSAVSGGNWEGGGVTPEVKVSAPDALKVAHARALRVLIERELAGPWRDTLERTLKNVEGR
jgi:C-terminal processing protease CtpA/Prc/Arc/MetJ family transcription regulator